MRTQDELENKAIEAPTRRHALDGVEEAITQPQDPVMAAHPRSRELLEAERNVRGLDAELAATWDAWEVAREDVIRRIDNSRVDPSHDPAVRAAYGQVQRLQQVVYEAKVRRAQLREAYREEIYRARLSQDENHSKRKKLEHAERRSNVGFLARGLARLREFVS